jgi:hypothetical protein
VMTATAEGHLPACAPLQPAEQPVASTYIETAATAATPGSTETAATAATPGSTETPVGHVPACAPLQEAVPLVAAAAHQAADSSKTPIKQLLLLLLHQSPLQVTCQHVQHCSRLLLWWQQRCRSA